MSWHTPLGDRILEGTEAAFYLGAMQHAVEYLQEMEDSASNLDVVTGDRIFDTANFEQKAILLRNCLAALLDPTVEVPPLTNVSEAAAFFPFAFLLREIAFEIDQMQDFEEEYRYYCREVVWSVFEEFILPNWQAAAEEDGEDEDERDFSSHSNNFDLWKRAIDCLLERIFWDRDWMMSTGSPQFLDGIEKELAETADLKDYFTTRLPKVTEEEAIKALDEVKNWQDSHKLS